MFLPPESKMISVSNILPLMYQNQIVYFHSAEHMEELADNSITLIVTSPPYWNVRDYGKEQIGFKQSYADYIASMNHVWQECIRVLAPNGKIAINFQPLPISSEESGFNRRVIKDIMWDVQHFFYNHDFYLSGMHYWDKASYINNVSWGSYPKPTNINSNTSFEQIYVFVKPGKTRTIHPEIMQQNLLSKEEWRHWAVRCIWDDISPVIKINSKGENHFGHAAPFPEDIPYRLIRMHTVENENVLDPFLGSGTTLKMCRITKRKGFGYEINPDYAELIKNRIDEPWDIPQVESMYVNFGVSKLQRIIDTVIEESLNNIEPNSSVDLLRAKILKKLGKSKLLSKSIIQKVVDSHNSNDEGEDEIS